MKRIHILLLVVITLTVSSCSNSTSVDHKADIDNLLTQWHKAASDANFETYFACFETDTSIFMGTDATERWTIKEFKPWAKPYFDRGRAWDFKAVNRTIYLAQGGTVAWFDEELDTPNMGPCRGTGTLRWTGKDWKISHYNLSIPIPNAIVGNVVEQIKEENNKEN